MATAITPPPPPGFVLNQAAPPPPPPGFTLDTPAATSEGVPGAQVEGLPTERPGFIDRVMADFAERGQMLEEIKQAEAAGEQTFGESVLQTSGKVVAGGILDVIGEGLISGVDFLSDITPDEIEDPIVQSAISAGHALLETDIGKAGLDAAQKGLKAWNEFKGENPRAGRNIEAVVDIGLLVAPVKGRPKVQARPTFVDKLATRVEAKATVQSLRQKMDFVEELIRPKQDKKVREDEIRRSAEGGLLSPREVERTSRERAIADEVSKLDGITKKKNLLGNFNVIKEANRAEAKSLKDALRKNDVDIPDVEINNALDGAIEKLAKDPVLIGDAEKIATNLAERMKDFATANPKTASGLLQARKDFDKLVKDSRPKLFDAAQENAISSAVREVRQSVNDLIDSKVADVGVKASLQKQSNLFRALDTIAPKAADEASNAILRMFQNLSRKTNLGASFTQKISTGLAITGAGTALAFNAAAVAPFLIGAAGVGGLTMAGTKLIASPGTKRAIASLLRASDKAIRATKDKALLAQLRLDRAAVFEISKQLQETEQ